MEMYPSLVSAAPPKPYAGIQVSSAVFLKSGDIRVHTAFVAEAKLLIEHADRWPQYVGNQVTMVTPTYGVVIHDIATGSFDPNRRLFIQ